MQSTEHKRPDILWGNVVFLFLSPILAIIGLIWWFSAVEFSWTPIMAYVVLHFATGLGITAGYHRLFSHRSYKANNVVKVVLSILGAATWENSAVEWCSDHRRHHRLVDTDDDPYNAHRGFWYSHILWICKRGKFDGDLSNVRDLLRDPITSWQHRNYFAISTTFNLGVPILLGLLVGDVWSMLLWAGLVRVVLVHHTTFLINSWAHMFGTQPYSDQNTARDSAWLAFLTHGEGYHNYHHAFETDYRNGRAWYHWDPGKWLIASLAGLGWASDLRRIPDDMVLRRRFEEGRSRFDQQLDHWGEAWEAWKGEVSGRANETQAAFQAHLIRAEARIDDALSDLRAKRQAWVSACQQNHTPAQIRALRRTMRKAQRSIKASLNEWEQMMSHYALTMAPAPA
jgi:stearoyl-CoA desaturase (delta-9 desaturase)